MTEARPLVSAVIPVHNGERFIREAVASVLAQTYQPMECIVVDDGSTDRTGAIVSHFRNRVRYLSQARRGPSAARNAGVRVARGEFIAFLDADDSWAPTKIARQMEQMVDHPELGLVYCAMELVDPKGGHLEFAPAPEPAAVLRNVLLNEGPWLGLGSTGLVRRHAFDVAGGFDERVRGAEDSDLAWRLAASFPLAAVAEPLATYRQHSDQIHRDLSRWERDWKLVLTKAFDSALLPSAVQSLQRRARTNTALTVAHHRRQARRPGAIAKVLEAFWLSPWPTSRAIARSGRRRIGLPSARRR